VVVLTRDAVVGRLSNVTVAPITRTVRNINTEVKLQPSDGVPSVCAISLDNIITIDRLRMGDLLTTLNRDVLMQIFNAIRVAFDMP
jgi:mRNA interferase MazF